MKQKKKQIGIISCVLLVLVALFGAAIWFMNRPKEEEKVATNVGVEWYDANGKEFTITTAEQLYELAALSDHYDFAGQTIKLGADIVVNEGDADDWGITFPEKIWDQPIDGFAGTFDGQGHTISGIYCMGYLYKVDAAKLTPLPAGLFSNTKESCVIKNFKLVNSYFCSDLQDGAGTISACGGGTFDSIYSNATLVSYKFYNGGIIGMASESTTVTNCWYDGKMEILGGYPRYTSGLIGRAMNKEADFLIEHCLVTATMYNETEKTGVAMGALLGNVMDSSTVTINDCFVASHLTNEYGAAVGSVYGVSETNATVNVSHTYATEEGYDKIVGAVLGTANGMPVGFPTETLTGYGAYQWTTLDFDKYWSAVEGSTPILTTFADNALELSGVEKYIDISWYDEEASDYVLYDMADLYGFSILSQSYNFENKTVKLGADITVNTGKASDWGKTAPTFTWISISSNTMPFAGTFDGQMHTISGIYHSADTAYSGLFSTTATTATIKNLKLTNSYLTTTNLSFGSIAGRGRGTFDTIYSDAIVVSDGGNVGGIIGQVPGDGGVTMKNCWFAGEVISLGNVVLKRNTGGLIGVSYSDSTVSNCLNTGTIDATVYSCTNSETSKAIAPMVGGLIGKVDNKSTLKLSQSLNVGPVKYNAASTGGYGSIVGWSSSSAQIANTYSLQDSCPLIANGEVSGWAIALKKDRLEGLEGYRWTALDFSKYWTAVNAETPALKSFAGAGMSVSGVTQMVDVSWYQENKSTYVLNDAADLYGLAYISQGFDFAGKTVKLGADITINTGAAAEWANAAPVNEWYCISAKNKPFAGTFDGQMHTVSGLYIQAESNNVGLFSATGATSMIKNLKLTNSYINSTGSDVGSVAGQGRGVFDTIYSDAVIQACRERVGGVIGMGYGTKVVMKNCWFAGTVTNKANMQNYRGTGGIIGTLFDEGKATLEGCLNTGTIDVTAYTYNQSGTGSIVAPVVAPLAGGIVGWVKTAKTTIDIKNCLNTGKVLISASTNNGYGAIVGYTENIKGTVVSTTYATTAPLSGSKVTGTIFRVSEEEISGYEGYQWTLLDFDKYWAVVLDGEPGTPILKSFASVVPSLAEVDKMLDISWIDEAAGSKKDPYRISSRAALYGLAMLSAEAGYNGFAGKYIQLTEDIIINKGNAGSWGENAPDYSWTPIGNADIPFAGYFDGGNHTISGIYINSTSENLGLFGYLKPAAGAERPYVKNLKIVNSYITSSGRKIGSVAGTVENGAIFDSVYSEAVVISSNRWLAGFVGLALTAEVDMNNCWFAGEVKSTVTTSKLQGTGGFIGDLNAKSTLTMTNCLNTGLIDASAYEAANPVCPCAAGYVGYVEGNATNYATVRISNCINTGSVLVNEKATVGYGPFIGYRGAGDIKIKDSVFVMAKTYSSATHSNVAVTNLTNVTQVTKDADLILMAPETLATDYGFDFNKIWTAIDYTIPVLKSFEDQIIDTSWYVGHENDATYTLKDRADFYGLAVLSQTRNFVGKTIQLDADIVVNVGDADSWSKGAPSLKWLPIGSTACPFAGTFDGGMCTISGIYCNTTAENTGLFGCLQNKNEAYPTIQNLQLVNSYIKSSARKAGSIVGSVLGKADIDSVYSEAIVESSREWLGGFAGLVFNAEVTMNNCWFAGKVTSTVTTGAYQCTGGFVGNVHSVSKLTMTNCLNTGTVDVSSFALQNADGNYRPFAGGFIGRMEGNSTSYATVEIRNSINEGAVLINPNVTPVITYGPFVGERVGMLNIWNSVYVMAGEYNAKTSSNITESSSYHNVTKLTSKTDLVGKDVVEAFGFEANPFWKANSEDIPTLKDFAK